MLGVVCHGQMLSTKSLLALCHLRRGAGRVPWAKRYGAKIKKHLLGFKAYGLNALLRRGACGGHGA
jgi:hypothetical protein